MGVNETVGEAVEVALALGVEVRDGVDVELGEAVHVTV